MNRAVASDRSPARRQPYALIIPDYGNPAYAAIIDGAHEAAAARGSHLITASSSGSGAALASYLDLFGEIRPAGLLVAGSESSEDAAAGLEGIDVPWLLVNRSNPYAHRYVILPDEDGAARAAEHLIKLGHRQIAMVAGPPSAETAGRRQRGFEAALLAANLSRPTEYIVDGDYTAAGGAAATESLLALPDRPSAIVAANVASAIGAVHAAQVHGVSVPEQLSVIAIHDLPLCDYLAPALTSVRLPLRELGHRAVELVDLTHPGQAIKQVVAGRVEVVVRSSTGPVPVRSRARLFR